MGLPCRFRGVADGEAAQAAQAAEEEGLGREEEGLGRGGGPIRGHYVSQAPRGRGGGRIRGRAPLQHDNPHAMAVQQGGAVGQPRTGTGAGAMLWPLPQQLLGGMLRRLKGAAAAELGPAAGQASTFCRLPCCPHHA